MKRFNPLLWILSIASFALVLAGVIGMNSETERGAGLAQSVLVVGLIGCLISLAAGAVVGRMQELLAIDDLEDQ